MVWISYSIGIVSLLALTLGAILVIVKQSHSSSRAVYYFLGLIVSVMGWIIGNMFVVYFSQQGPDPKAESQALLSSRLATIISMVGMVSIILFVRMVSKKRVRTPLVIVIALFLFGGVFGLTISGDYVVVHKLIESGGYYFYIAKTSITWVIFDAGLPLFAGAVFLIYLIKQRNFTEEKYRKVINIMIVGVIIAFFASALVFAIRKILYAATGKILLLHMEYISVAVGALIISISLYLGGIEAFFYSTEVHAIFIFKKDGASIYSASAKRDITIGGHSVLGVIAAFSEFAGELVGVKVYPKEIDLGDSCLMIETHENYVCFLSSRFSTYYLREATKNLLVNLTDNLNEEEISSLVEQFFAFKPKVQDNVAAKY
ncbi:MAG: hypothetical protein ACTSQF_06240 [Candidatus Heimdallarchaeaceae archaeon]